MSGVRGLRIFLPSPGIGRWWPKPFDVRDGVGSAAKDDIVSEIPGVAVEQTEDPGLEFDDRYQIDKNVGFRHAYKTLIPYFVRVWHEFQKERPPHLPKPRRHGNRERKENLSVADPREGVLCGNRPCPPASRWPRLSLLSSLFTSAPYIDFMGRRYLDHIGREGRAFERGRAAPLRYAVHPAWPKKPAML